MTDICELIGERIRNERNRRGLTQEELAERAGLHNTYIGQIERAEKNATLITLAKIADGLEVPLVTLFTDAGACLDGHSTAAACYRLIHKQSEKEQRALLAILEQLIAYKHIK